MNVVCIGRQSLIHCTTREILALYFVRAYTFKLVRLEHVPWAH